MEWRPARIGDAGAIGRLSLEILGELGEPAEIFAERIALCPEGCHVLVSGQEIVGHMISHPWVRGNPPAMNQMLGQLPAVPDCWYIHEVALAESARGRGGVPAILAVVGEAASAAGLPVLALVAVEGAAAYWKRLGFRPAVLDAAKVASYGGAADYLEMTLEGRAPFTPASR